MTKLKLGDLTDETPIRRQLSFPADLYRDMTIYGELLAEGSEAKPVEPERLAIAMLTRFLATDRAFQRAKRERGRTATQ